VIETQSVDRGAAVKVRELSHSYGSGPAPLSVLHDVELEIAAGSYVALTGPSGAGKTTLLSILGGLERPRAGEVMVAGYSVGELEGDELASFRREMVGFVFQHFGLLGALTALDNVELALALSGDPRKARRGRAMELLEGVGLAERANHLPKALSGGERQRVAIARAMANQPRLILADEPTGNLDPEAGRIAMEHLEQLRDATGCTVILVSHNPLIAARAQLEYRLEHGTIAPAQ